MSQFDWKEFRNGFTSDFQVFSDQSPVDGIPSGSTAPVLSTTMQSGGGIPKIWGYIYDGPDAGILPTKFCSIAFTGGGQFQGSPGSTTFRVGPLIAMTSIGTNGYFDGNVTPDADLDMIIVGQYQNFGFSSSRIRTLRLADATRLPANEVETPLFVIPEVDSNSSQYEVGFFLDDIVPSEEQFRIFFRYNNGSVITQPGGAGWTAWEHLADYDYSTDLIGAGIDVSNGFFPGIGIWINDASIDWDDVTPNIHLDFDDIYVTNYTEIPV